MPEPPGRGALLHTNTPSDTHLALSRRSVVPSPVLRSSGGAFTVDVGHCGTARGSELRCPAETDAPSQIALVPRNVIISNCLIRGC